MFLVSRLGQSLNEAGRYTAHAVSESLEWIQLNAAFNKPCIEQQKLSSQTRCAKLDALDFICAAASIAAPPPPGTLGGEETKEGGQGIQEFSILSIKECLLVK